MNNLLQAVDMIKADDKIIAFICATAIVMALIITNNEQAANITSHVITGMFSAAMGRVTK